ncbi:MAG: ImmA/IrrE family metallo-endopeptidase [Desulfomonilaceae bacterium]
MLNRVKNEYRPDYASSPGEILEETLEGRGIQKKDFAERCGLSAKHIHQIIGGEASVTPGTAILFERVLGIDSQIWNNLEAKYRSFKARQMAKQEAEGLFKWSKKFPVKELINRGFIEQPKNQSHTVEYLLRFFGVASTEAWNFKYGSMAVSYRHSPSFNSEKEHLATWLRIGELLAQRINTEPYNRLRFKQALSEIRSLTGRDPGEFEPKMKELCRQTGVAIIFVREFPRTHVSAATRWLSQDKALIQLSLRYKANDHFWFSFFHEGAHILLHGKKNVFIEDSRDDSDAEVEANNFAANTLIPLQRYRLFTDKGILTENSISLFAESINIASGIVVGRLQYDKKIGFDQFNHLKVRFELNQDG